jgi:S-adenosylmethionine:diacylglycerol 3-amino-3-carboxypropyl transferase
VSAATAWQEGRFDARTGPKRVLFGRMYEDVEIERASFRAGERVFCIASAGCTAIRLCHRNDVVACDINPTQLAYTARRIGGAPIETGTAEKVMGFGRALMPLAGWRSEVLHSFLSFTEPEAQLKFWRKHLDTWRFRTGFDAMMSVTGLRAVYAPAFLDFLPSHFGAVLRDRMERCFARFPNASNPYARALLVGDAPAPEAQPRDAARIELVCTDAASYLESCAERSFGGFALSNILDGAEPSYRQRLFAALRRAATPDAVVVRRSFGEATENERNYAGLDRSMLWGVVDVRRVEDL